MLNKMHSIRAGDIDLAVAQKHRDTLAKVSDSFRSKEHADFKFNSPYIGLVSWAQNFCEYCCREHENGFSNAQPLPQKQKDLEAMQKLDEELNDLLLTETGNFMQQ